LETSVGPRIGKSGQQQLSKQSTSAIVRFHRVSHRQYDDLIGDIELSAPNGLLMGRSPFSEALEIEVWSFCRTYSNNCSTVCNNFSLSNDELV
jgi:hypothetical protein